MITLVFQVNRSSPLTLEKRHHNQTTEPGCSQFLSGFHFFRLGRAPGFCLFQAFKMIDKTKLAKFMQRLDGMVARLDRKKELWFIKRSIHFITGKRKKS